MTSRQADPARHPEECSDDDPSADDIYDVGTLANVLQLLKLPDGTVKVLVEGGDRVRDRALHRAHRLPSRPISPTVLVDDEGEEARWRRWPAR
jgi:ATP-dependent Lon protease